MNNQYCTIIFTKYNKYTIVESKKMFILSSTISQLTIERFDEIDLENLFSNEQHTNELKRTNNAYAASSTNDKNKCKTGPNQLESGQVISTNVYMTILILQMKKTGPTT